MGCTPSSSTNVHPAHIFLARSREVSQYVCIIYGVIGGVLMGCSGFDDEIRVALDFPALSFLGMIPNRPYPRIFRVSHNKTGGIGSI